MRTLVLIAGLALATAGTAAAQDFDRLNQLQLDELRLQQQMQQQRSIDLQNQLMSLEARQRAEQAIIQGQRPPPGLPSLPYPGAPPASIDTSHLPSIPDRALADSNRRVQEISKTRR
ncbi:hypothetical protein [Phenylobacterium sp.]|uniref:hypothetical protein n=1 Tax=Phenylobacterium sp. TaxID=1871053 RepID=UPI00391A35E9